MRAAFLCAVAKSPMKAARHTQRIPDWYRPEYEEHCQGSMRLCVPEIVGADKTLARADFFC